MSAPGPHRRRRNQERGKQQPKVNVNVGFTQEEFDSLDELAEANGISVGRFVRECAIRTAAHALARAQAVAEAAAKETMSKT